MSMNGDETKVDDRGLAEGVFKHLLASQEPNLPSTVDHAVHLGRRGLRRRRYAVGAGVASLAVIAVIAAGAVLEPQRQTIAPVDGVPPATATPSTSPSRPTLATPQPLRSGVTAAPGATASTVLESVTPSATSGPGGLPVAQSSATSGVTSTATTVAAPTTG